MIDLYNNNKYDMKILKENIYAVKLIDILKTQKIDVNFAVKYLLNKKYQIHEDDNITSYVVLMHQTHINYKELQKQSKAAEIQTQAKAAARESALAKLADLGLTAEEIAAL